MRKLVIKEANPPLEVHVRNGIVLGTDAASAVKLDGSYIEPRHAKISLVGDHVFIEDLETKNGTFVNGKKILRRALKKGDLIELGGNRLVYDEDDKPDPPPEKKTSAKAPAAAAAIGTSASKGSSPAPPSRISGRQEVLRPSGRLPAQPEAGKVEPGSTQQKTVKIKLDGNYLDPRKSPSGKSAPAAPAKPGGSSSHQPAALRHARAFAIPSGLMGSLVGLEYVGDIETKELVRRFREGLPKFMCPAQVTRLERIELSDAGKTKRLP